MLPSTPTPCRSARPAPTPPPSRMPTLGIGIITPPERRGADLPPGRRAVRHRAGRLPCGVETLPLRTSRRESAAGRSVLTAGAIPDSVPVCTPMEGLSRTPCRRQAGDADRGAAIGPWPVPRTPSSQGGEVPMSSHDRRAAARRRAWGRGPIILRFEPLEGRQLLHGGPADARPGRRRLRHAAQPRLGRLVPRGRHDPEPGGRAGDGPVQRRGLSPRPPRSSAPGRSRWARSRSLPACSRGSRRRSTRSSPCPQTPIPGYSAGSGPIYIELWVDPEGTVPESNPNNNVGVGQGYDTSVVAITPRPAVAPGRHLAGDLSRPDDLGPDDHA